MGENPDVYVDEAGTSHVVWNEPRGAAADVAVYCRLKRGASTCDSRVELSWVKEYGYGDNEAYNVDNIGPRIVRVGEQLVVLSSRFPTVAVKPAGRGDRTLLAWTSLDGGATFSPPSILGASRFDDVAVVGPAERPRLLAYGQDPLCSPRAGEPPGQGCLVAYTSGAFNAAAAILTGPQPGTDYYPNLDSYDGTVLSSTTNTGGTTWVRRWSGVEPLDSASTWTLSGAMAGSQPVLASGPGGSYLMTRGGTDDPILGEVRVRRLTTAADGVVSAGEPVIVSDGGGGGQLVQDPGGALHGVWREGDGVTYRSAPRGSLSFSTSQVLVPGLDNGQWRLGAAADGGGVAVLNSEGQVVAASFGTSAPTGRPGLAGIPGGGNVECSKVKFGAFDIETRGGCFLLGAGSAKGRVVSEGAVFLNGLEIVPEPGSRLVFDPQALTIDTVSAIPGSKAAGVARVLLRQAGAEVELFKGQLAQNLAGLKPGSTLFTFTPDLDRTHVFGFPVASNLPVKLTSAGVEVELAVKLPPAFGSFTGRAKLIADKDTGLRLESLEIRIGPVPLGALIVKKIEIDWQAGGTWRGYGEIEVPATGTIKMQVEFESGSFISATASYDPRPAIPLGPKVYLTSVGGGLSLNPTVIKATATVGAPVPVEPPVLADGTFTMKFPEQGPGSFMLDAVIRVYSIEIAKGYVRFDTDGYASFGGSGSIDIGPVSGSINVDGFIDATTDQFGADVAVGGKYCVINETTAPPSEECETRGLRMVISSIGFAVCTGLGGYDARWDDFDPLDLGNFTLTCRADDYKIPNPRAGNAAVEARQGTSFAVPGRLPSVTLAVPGVGGKPAVIVRGPGGVLAQPGSAAKGVEVFSVAGGSAVYVGIRTPRKGTYSVEPAPGSVPIGQVLLSEGVRAAKVSGAVSRAGGQVRVSTNIARLGSVQRVLLRERSHAGTRTLGRVDKGSRSTLVKLRGPAGKRVVEAVVMIDGVPVDVVRLGTYKAPGPRRPGPATKVAVALRGQQLRVRFLASNRAALTSVVVVGSEGSRTTRVLDNRKGRITLRGFTWDKRVVVRIQSVDEQGRRGPVVKRAVLVRR